MELLHWVKCRDYEFEMRWSDNVDVCPPTCVEPCAHAPPARSEDERPRAILRRGRGRRHTACSLLGGGSTDWQTPLDCACQWQWLSRGTDVSIFGPSKIGWGFCAIRTRAWQITARAQSESATVQLDSNWTTCEFNRKVSNCCI